MDDINLSLSSSWRESEENLVDGDIDSRGSEEKGDTGREGEYDVVRQTEERHSVDDEERGSEGSSRSTLKQRRGGKGDVKAGGEIKRNDTQSTSNSEERDDDDITSTASGLPQDMFSIMLLMPPLRSHPRSSREDCRAEKTAIFVFALVYLFQIATLSIVLWELFSYRFVSDEGIDTPFDIPVNVENSTRVAQFFALVIALVQQDDVTSSLCLIFNWRLPAALPVSRLWFTSICLMKLFEGLLGLVVSLVIVVQSRDVINLFSDFAGMAFVSHIDNVAFSLLKQGFVNTYLCKKAEEVLRFPLPELEQGAKRSHKMMGFILLVGMIAPWAIFTSRQLNGVYYASSIVVEIGDSDRSTWQAHRSGVYELDNIDWYGYPIYVEVGGANAASIGFGVFRYCRGNKGWTFAEISHLGEGCACCSFMYQSEETRSFDILSLKQLFSVEGSKKVPVPDFALTRVDRCSYYTCYRGTCNNENGQCKCDENWFGQKCEYELCSHVAVSSNLAFPAFSSSYDALLDGNGELVLSYGRPVYYAFGNEGPDYYVTDIIAFTGRRWYVTFWDYVKSTAELSDIVNAHLLHGDSILNGTGAYYFSEPSGKESPSGLKWYRWMDHSRGGLLHGEQMEQPSSDYVVELVNVVFGCEDCTVSDENKYPCGYFGKCIDNRCKCEPGHSGPTCNKPPLRFKGTNLIKRGGGGTATCGVCRGLTPQQDMEFIFLGETIYYTKNMDYTFLIDYTGREDHPHYLSNEYYAIYAEYPPAENETLLTFHLDDSGVVARDGGGENATELLSIRRTGLAQGFDVTGSYSFSFETGRAKLVEDVDRICVGVVDLDYKTCHSNSWIWTDVIFQFEFELHVVADQIDNETKAFEHSRVREHSGT